MPPCLAEHSGHRSLARALLGSVPRSLQRFPRPLTVSHSMETQLQTSTLLR
jgi:hypothetical protein